jgi:RNA recognition motif-containing protein
VSTKLFVSNLPLSATTEMLITQFCKFGCVVSVAFEPAAGANRRGAFVEMDTSSAAHRAIAALNLSDLDGRVISVFLALSSVSKSVA